eukprot:12414327-Karenia_brevis.AAC.1
MFISTNRSSSYGLMGFLKPCLRPSVVPGEVGCIFGKEFVANNGVDQRLASVVFGAGIVLLTLKMKSASIAIFKLSWAMLVSFQL